jgi:signal transduction histidine kinase
MSADSAAALERARWQATLRLLRRLRHDLATPLSGASLHLEMAKRRLSAAAPDTGKALESVQFAQREVGYTSSILQPLSEVFGYAEEAAREIDLSAALCHGAQRLQAEAQRRGVTLTLPDAGGPAISASPRQTEDALQVLTAEAVRHCPEGGSVTWTVEEDEDAVRATCQLTGPLAAETLDAVFSARRAQSGGADLALVVARWCLESQGAALSLSRNPEGTSLVVQVTKH